MSLLGDLAVVERSEQYKLPQLRLRELGLKHVPAVPVDLGGMLGHAGEARPPDKAVRAGLPGPLQDVHDRRDDRPRLLLPLRRTRRPTRSRQRHASSLQAFLGSNPSAISPSRLAASSRSRTRRSPTARTERPAIAHDALARRSEAMVDVLDDVPRRLRPGPAASGRVGGDGGRDAARQGDRGVLPHHRPRTAWPTTCFCPRRSQSADVETWRELFGRRLDAGAGCRGATPACCT